MTRAAVPADLESLVTAVGAALDGSGPPVATAPTSDGPPLPPGTALLLRTSGSTGEPREVALTAAALRASGDATHERLGGPGHWVLTLPATHVAGIQVVARSRAAGLGLTVAPDGEPFTPASFAALVARSPSRERRYVSLVPTQLHRLVTAAEGGDAVGLDALRALDAVLVGGAATSPTLLRRARAAGARVVVTYGMTETCGGCVYDGVPLGGVRVRLAPGPGSDRPSGPSGPGVVEISGPVLAAGYVDDAAATAAAFRSDADGTRWFRTSDLGTLRDGALDVLGRADDVVVTGGVNVAPAAVEAAVAELDGIGEVCVVGVPDPEWGQALVAVVTTRRTRTGPGTDGLLATVRAHVTDRLGRAAAPRRVLVVADLPRRGPGKVDRVAVARLAGEPAVHE
ncbi:AMP-binding protein [Cellulosimicrobium terreum]|nr:AMP-binding protein [Cellulosimicrobium terreum]